jgi:hypothetical protein
VDGTLGVSGELERLHFLILVLPAQVRTLCNSPSQGTPRVQVFCFLYFNKSLLVRCPWITHIILAAQEAEIRRIMVQSHDISKIPSTEEGWWNGSTGSVGLPSKHEALNSNPSTTKKFIKNLFS